MLRFEKYKKQKFFNFKDAINDAHQALVKEQEVI